MKTNLKKLVYHYRYLKLDLDEVVEQHTELTIEFEKEFSNVLKESKEIEVPAKPKDKKKPNTDESVKKIYKKTAKQLHPDKGGDEEEFKELNERYKSNDLLGVIDFAIDNNIDIDYSEGDVELMNNSVDSLKSQIDDYKNKIAYVWKFGTPFQRGQVLNTLSNHLGREIKIDELSDEQKIKLGLDLENQ
jgi:hypothetical protein